MGVLAWKLCRHVIVILTGAMVTVPVPCDGPAWPPGKTSRGPSRESQTSLTHDEQRCLGALQTQEALVEAAA